MSRPDADYRVLTWLERDRAHVSIVDAATEEITYVDWWDDDVAQLVEDGFLDQRNYAGSALAYARYLGILPG